MPPKRKNLSSAFEKLNAEPEIATPVQTKQPEQTPEEARKKAAARKKSPVAKSRVGKKGVTFYVDHETHKQLKVLSVEKETPMDALLREALNELFQKNNKPRIA